MTALPARLSCLPALLLGLAACQQETVREIDWAKAALARNPAYEIVATDESAGVFTVRDTATGEMKTLKLSELVAAPLPPKPAKPEPAASPESNGPGNPDSDEDTDPTLAVDQTTEPAAIPPSTGTPLAEGPGYSIARGTGSKPAPAPETLEGPGYRIERSGDARASGTRDANTTRQDTAATGAERRSDPIICQGDRLMRIDGETIEFSGDAVIAEKGCDLYISNARIRAGGVGIIARQARVHIANSTISGARASYEASDGAEIYVAQSTFTGIGRRFDTASMNDLGGNSYLSR
jgi:hypothetical protein